MAFAFSWAGAIGLFAGLAALGLAALVFWSRPDRSQNRRLALMLALEGVLFFGAHGMGNLTDVAADAWAWRAVSVVVHPPLPFAYLLFVATLDTPLVAPLRHPLVERGLQAGLVLSPLVWFLRPEAFLVDVVPGSYTPLTGVPGPGFFVLGFAIMAGALVSLVAAVSFWRHTEAGTVRRAQARLYAVAFGFRDMGMIVTIGLFTILDFSATGPLRFVAGGGMGAPPFPAATTAAYVSLLTYGILKTQLFEIDLKVKLGIERSTFVAVFGVAFLAVSEIAEALLGVDGTLYGVGAAVVIGLFFRRVEQGAEYVADRLMPGVEDTEEYRAERKREVYRAAVESAAEDEVITEKERDVLAGLQDELALDRTDALEIERDVLGAPGEDGQTHA